MQKMKPSIFSNAHIRRLNEQELRIKSVSTPCAQSTTRCGIDSDFIQDNFDYERDVIKNPVLSPVIRAVVEMQYRFALRISEVLSIQVSDISRSGKIRIKALKGSVNRVVDPIDMKLFWLNANNSVLPLSKVFSRFYFYREYKKLGWYSTFGNSSVNSVTHYFRHLQGLELQNDFQDIELTARQLGHKSTKSTQYYVQKSKK